MEDQLVFVFRLLDFPGGSEKKESKVAQSCLTLCDPMDYSLASSLIHGIFQARILKWVAISFSRGSSWPRDWTWVPHTAGRLSHQAEPPGKPDGKESACKWETWFQSLGGKIHWRRAWQPTPLLIRESLWLEELIYPQTHEIPSVLHINYIPL